MTKCDRGGGEGAKNCPNQRDVIYECPLFRSPLYATKKGFKLNMKNVGLCQFMNAPYIVNSVLPPFSMTMFFVVRLVGVGEIDIGGVDVVVNVVA